MRKYPTQEECRAIWLKTRATWDLLSREAKLEAIRKIDDMTPWSVTEPKWWLEMMEEKHKLL